LLNPVKGKTQKQDLVVQNKAQKVADKLTEEVIFITKGVQHIQVQAGTVYQLLFLLPLSYLA
jgi:hypothetical protein